MNKMTIREWLINNKIKHRFLDEDVVEIHGFGKCYVQDTSKVKSVFKTNSDKSELNLTANRLELQSEGIEYIVLEFGDNWYYCPINSDFDLKILKYVGERELPSCPYEIANIGIHSPFELLNGSFGIEKWVEKAKHCQHIGVGVCDLNTMASHYTLQKVCEANGLKFVFGYSLNVNDGVDVFSAKVYAQTQQGLQNLLRIQKAIMVDSEDKAIDITTLKTLGAGNVIVIGKTSASWVLKNMGIATLLASSFEGAYFQVDLSEYKAERIDAVVLHEAKVYFDNLYHKSPFLPALICDAYYLDKDDARNKIILNKIATGAAHEQSEEQFFKDADEHYVLFHSVFNDKAWDIDKLFVECASNAMNILKNAHARYDTSRNYMPQYDMTEKEREKYGTTHNMFCELLEDGLSRLCPKGKEKLYRDQMEYEKYIIESTNNVDYLLVQWDTCNWARSNGILVGCGRGSAAGSLLLYLLGVTLVDPIQYELIFERFLLPERAGLYSAQTTMIGADIETKKFVEISMGGRTIQIDFDSQLLVKRNGAEIVVFADELCAGDDVLLDRRDELFTIKELSAL